MTAVVALACLAVTAGAPIWEIDTAGTPRSGPLLVPMGGGGMAVLLPLGDRGLGGWGPSGDPLPGFPLQDGHGVVQRPALAGDAGGEPLVAWADDGGLLHLVGPRGLEQPGWPVDLGARPVTGVTACDLDGDGDRELAVGTSDARAHLLDLDGNSIQGWPLNLPEKLLWQPVQITLSGESGRALVMALANTRITAVGRDGAALPGWPLQVGSPAGSIPVTADIDSDGLMDVVFATQNRKVYVVDARGAVLEEWPFLLDDPPVRGPAALGAVDQETARPQIGVSTRDSVVYLINGDARLAGTWRWPNRPGAMPTQPIISQSDGFTGVIVGCNDGTVHAWNAEGAEIEGYPLEHGQRIMHTPAAGDVTGDGGLELAVVGVGGKLALYPLASGSRSPGPWPQTLSDPCNTGSYGASFLPVARVGDVIGEQTGPVEVEYEVERADVTGVSVAYSTDAGYRWTPTSAWRQTGTGILWRSEEDLPDGDYPECMLRITPFSRRGPGVAGTTPVFRLDNNRPPVIYLNTPRRGENGRWRITYAVEEPEGDTIQLQAQYSADGGRTWLRAGLTGPTVEIEPWMYGEPVYWPVPEALEGTDPNSIHLRLRAADRDPGPWQTIAGLSDSVGRPPAGQILAPETEVRDRVSLGVRLFNPEENPTEMSYQYTLDGGRTWKPATVTEPEEGAPSAYQYEIVWHSDVDEPAGDHPEVLFRAVPDETESSVAVPSSPFHLDNNHLPTVEVRSPGSWEIFQGVVPVRLELDDLEDDSLWVGVEYRPADGGAWRRADGVMGGGPLPSGSYRSVVRWNSSSDFPGVDSRELELRVLVADRDTVRSDVRGPIIVENDDLPAFMQASIVSRDRRAEELVVSFELADPGGRPLSLDADYSIDGGLTWRDARVEGDLYGLVRDDYGGRITWRYGSDVGESPGHALLRLTPTFGDNAGEPRVLELVTGS